MTCLHAIAWNAARGRPLAGGGGRDAWRAPSGGSCGGGRRRLQRSREGRACCLRVMRAALEGMRRVGGGEQRHEGIAPQPFASALTPPGLPGPPRPTPFFLLPAAAQARPWLVLLADEPSDMVPLGQPMQPMQVSVFAPCYARMLVCAVHGARSSMHMCAQRPSERARSWGGACTHTVVQAHGGLRMWVLAHVWRSCRAGQPYGRRGEVAPQRARHPPKAPACVCRVARLCSSRRARRAPPHTHATPLPPLRPVSRTPNPPTRAQSRPPPPPAGARAAPARLAGHRPPSTWWCWRSTPRAL